MKEMYPFKNLPDNNNIYVVWQYGAAAKMKNPSQIPRVQVILRKIDINNENFLDEYDIVVYIPMTELDSIRIGSVWQNKKLLKEKWTNYNTLNYVENVEFNFDFISNSPQTVKYNEYISSLNNSLSNVYKCNIQKSEENRLKNFINKTIYTKLIDKDITVLIPAMELFISTYTPEHKGIKQNLLKFNLDIAIDKYIVNNNTKVTDDGYFIELRNKMEDSNIKFLAFAKHNKISRKRISYLSSSLELNSGDIDYGYKIIYPNVLPYHPSHFYIKCDGVWLNDKTFLVHRIYLINLPLDMDVYAIINNTIYNVSKKFYKPEGSEGKRKTQENNEDDETEEEKKSSLNNNPLPPIDSDELPTSRVSVPKVKTQVNIIDDKKPTILIQTEEKEVEQKIEDYNAEETLDIDIKPNNEEEENNNENFLTDGEEDDSGNNSAQKIEYVSKHRDEETDHLFQLIIKILDDLNLEDIIYDYNILDGEFNRLKEDNHTTFYETLLNNNEQEDTLKDNWYRLKQREEGELKYLGYREYLLIEIELKKDDFSYLLEIGKKSSEAGFLGVVFKLDDNYRKMSNDKLINFLKNIVKNKGNYSKQISKENRTLKPVDLNVLYKTYKHSLAKKEMVEKLKNSIKNKIKVLIEYEKEIKV